MSTNESGVKNVNYRTTDIYFSAYLCALDIPMVTSEVISENAKGKKLAWIFKMPENDIQHLKASFFGGTGKVYALKFCERLKSLKSMCYV